MYVLLQLNFVIGKRHGKIYGFLILAVVVVKEYIQIDDLLPLVL